MMQPSGCGKAGYKPQRWSEPLNTYNTRLGFTQQPESQKVVFSDDETPTQRGCAMSPCSEFLCKTPGHQTSTKCGHLVPVNLARYLPVISERKDICTVICRVEIVYCTVKLWKKKINWTLGTGSIHQLGLNVVKSFIQKQWSWNFRKHWYISFVIDPKQVFSMFPVCAKRKWTISVWFKLFHPLCFLTYLTLPSLPRLGMVTKLKAHSPPISVCGYKLKQSTEIILVSPDLHWISAART